MLSTIRPQTSAQRNFGADSLAEETASNLSITINVLTEPMSNKVKDKSLQQLTMQVNRGENI